MSDPPVIQSQTRDPPRTPLLVRWKFTRNMLATFLRSLKSWANLLTLLVLIATLVVGSCTYLESVFDDQRKEEASIFIQPDNITKHVSVDGTEGWVFRAKIANGGSTPTTHLKVWLQCASTPEEAFRVISTSRPNGSSALAGGTNDDAVEICYRTTTSMQSVMKSGGHLYVVGRATYDTIFDKRIFRRSPAHEMQFCVDEFDFSFVSENGVRTHLDPRAIHCPKFNCVDEECDSRGWHDTRKP